MARTVFVVVGYNGILGITGTAGAAWTREEAEAIQRREAWKLDRSEVMEVTVEGPEPAQSERGAL